jgi:CRP-like cAMP-binding protein
MLDNFMDSLPCQLRMKMSIYAYEQRYNKLKFFKDRSIQFISWICRLMQPQWYDQGEFYFFEDDDVEEMFFLIKGEAEFVLP